MSDLPLSIDQQYQSLLEDVRSRIKSGVTESEQLIHHNRVRAYWQIGECIATQLLEENFRSVYGERLYEQLGQDLDFRPRVLQHMVQFFRMYPQCPQTPGLTWTHYRYLINVQDEKERRLLEQRIISEGITSTQIKQFIPGYNALGTRRVNVRNGFLEVKRGVPYLYAIRQATDLEGKELDARLDLGFNIGIQKRNASYIHFVNSRLVVSKKEESGYRLETYKGETEILYTYGAQIERVVDGDTVIAHVDLGFGLTVRERFRLRGINAPELNTADGQRAKAHLTQVLLPSCDLQAGKAPLVIKTYKTDKYGRYVADLFLLPDSVGVFQTAAQGVLVNQLMLDAGLAEVYTG